MDEDEVSFPGGEIGTESYVLTEEECEKVRVKAQAWEPGRMVRDKLPPVSPPEHPQPVPK